MRAPACSLIFSSVVVFTIFQHIADLNYPSLFDIHMELFHGYVSEGFLWPDVLEIEYLY
jgi:hypothetical protein